jgi:serine/threonine protein kinase
MDYVDGKDLFHYLMQQRSFVPVKDVLRLLMEIGGALAYCHEDIYKFCMDKEEDDLQDDPNDGSKVLMDAAIKERLINKYRVIHNDIHSGNIIRRGDGSYVLLDFGLAIEGSNVIRSSRRRNGAPEFKSPEKWDNESILTTQSDIYSFGVVLYEYLAGRVPFLFDKTNSNMIEAEYLLAKAHKEKAPEPIYGLRKMAFEIAHPGETYQKDFPDWLEELILKCLSKSTEDRFKNAKELYNFALEHMNEDADVQVRSLKNEIAALQQKVEVGSQAEAKSNQAINDFVVKFQQQFDEILNKNITSQEELIKLKAENQQLRDQLNMLQLNDSSEKATRLEAENLQLKLQLSKTLENDKSDLVNQLQIELEQLHAENTQLRIQLTKKEESNSSSSASQKDKKIQEQNMLLISTEKELQLAKTEIDVLVKSYKALMKENAALKNK